MFESLLSFVENPQTYYLIISFFVWLTYYYTIRCDGVSDDIAGLLEYDGKLQGYEYGMLWRWVRYHIVGGNFPGTKKDQNGNKIPCGKEMWRHHLLSIIVFNITCLVTYQALVPVIGYHLALLSVLLLAVHPCSTQGVAWVSGLAYPLSLLWISVTLILMQFFYANQTLTHAVWVVPLFCLVQFLSIHAIFATTAMTWALLLFFGYWQFAILAFVLSVVMCFDQIRKTVSLRVNEFKKQHMEASTVLNWRKPVVAMKTFWYYVKHSLFPIRMGLYHEWNFHYNEETERADKSFWFGLAFFCLATCVFFKTDCNIIKLGILWYIIFSVGFWNIITAQQFVTERYIMVANLGLAILIAFLTENNLWIYSFILGAYICRTWCHLPTYDNELRFYQSNHWNFQKSEVALGNLGVTYARIGLPDSAKDSWLIATKINPDYDVPWVNIFYQYRTTAFTMIQNGDYEGGIRKLHEAYPYLDQALKCKVCHFPEQWKTEQNQLLVALKNPGTILFGELKRLQDNNANYSKMFNEATTVERRNEVQISIDNNNRQIANLRDYLAKRGISEPTQGSPYGTNYTRTF